MSQFMRTSQIPFRPLFAILAMMPSLLGIPSQACVPIAAAGENAHESADSAHDHADHAHHQLPPAQSPWDRDGSGNGDGGESCCPDSAPLAFCPLPMQTREGAPEPLADPVSTSTYRLPERASPKPIQEALGPPGRGCPRLFLLNCSILR